MFFTLGIGMGSNRQGETAAWLLGPVRVAENS